MVNWERFDGKPEDWACLLARTQEANPFQAWAWGEHKRAEGWQAEPWVARESGRTLACVQVLKKSLPLGGFLAYAPGGPILGLPETDGKAKEVLGSWPGAMRREGILYLRWRSHAPFSEERERAAGLFRRPSCRINSPHTIEIDLSKPVEVLRSEMSSKHRYYVRQAEKAAIDWEHGNSAALVRRMRLLYEEMGRSKGIERRLFDPGTIPSLAQAFGQDCLILSGSREGMALASCLVLKAGPSAFYLMAATGPEGRKLSASYAMIPRLFEILKAWGVTRLDFGGIDPSSPGAAGVNHFKRGFGGREILYLGEWEWSPWKPIAWGANALMRLKGL